MSALVICEEHRERARELVARAARPENWCRPYEAAKHEGDGPGVAVFEGYRCVFMYALEDGVLFRYLSISVHTTTGAAIPHPTAAFTIASWFGFTDGQVGPEPHVVRGRGPDWHLSVVAVPIAHVILSQRVEFGPAQQGVA